MRMRKIQKQKKRAKNIPKFIFNCIEQTNPKPYNSMDETQRKQKKNG